MEYEVGDTVFVNMINIGKSKPNKIEGLGTIESVTSNKDYYVRLFQNNALLYCRKDYLKLVLDQEGVIDGGE